MNEWERNRRLAELTRKAYPPGTRILLNHMDDPRDPVRAGMRGTVQFVDDQSQIHIQWDNGRGLALIPGVDSFPEMVHVGDITQLDGAKLPPVHIICGGSPCQDLSVAGARAGLAGERSGLFMEQIRITKEMRDAEIKRGRTAYLIRPRYFVWENVPGAFSSGEPKGEDFRCVLEEIVQIKVCGVSVPRPDAGRWEFAGRILLGDAFSLAWRCLDAQYWGVPQRRKRIFLVADFGGNSAEEILFK